MIFVQISQQLQLLSDLLLVLTDEQYNQKIEHLGHASIGGHTRHVIELVQCTLNGYTKGEVDYFNRSRDMLLETNRIFAQATLEQLEDAIKMPDKSLVLLTEKLDEAAIETSVSTTYYREILYNAEHAIHHLALIKVALLEMNLDLVEKYFGVAYSTIKYKATLSNT